MAREEEAGDIEVEIMRPGTFIAGNGQELTFTTEKLQAIAAAYDPAAYDAPVVVGHPDADAPAYGWVKKLIAIGDRLKALLHKVDPAFAELVRQGKYRKVSASFYMPDSPANPKPGSLSLRHVGFLGAQAPAVKGLKPVEFADAGGDLVVVEASPEGAHFAEQDGASTERLLEQVRALARQVEELRAAKGSAEADFAEERRQVRRRDHRAFLEGLFREGRFMPGYLEPMVAFMETLDGPGHVIEFAEAGDTVQKAGADFLRAYLARQPAFVEFREVAGAAAFEAEDEAATATRISAWVEQERAKGRSVSYSDGLQHVSHSRQR